jgi:hypothetical protein
MWRVLAILLQWKRNNEFCVSSTLSHKWHAFLKESIGNKILVLILCTTFAQIFSNTKDSEDNTNMHAGSRKVIVMLVRF